MVQWFLDMWSVAAADLSVLGMIWLNIWRHYPSGEELYLLGMPAMLVLIVKELHGGLSWHIHSNNVSLFLKNQ